MNELREKNTEIEVSVQRKCRRIVEKRRLMKIL